MTKEVKIQEDVSVIAREVLEQSRNQFTGKITFTLQMNQGGIGNISVNLEKKLKMRL